jgi:cell division septation protein DedD
VKEPGRYSDGGSGAFFVVAGSFLAEERAQNQLVILKGAGFPTAEIVRFAQSNFFSLCVGRFNNRKDAQALEKKLERNNIDAFVRTGN